MKQLELFDKDRNASASLIDADHSGIPEDHELLAMFEAARLAEGAHPRTVQREISQLRSICREAASISGSKPLTDVFCDVKLLAAVLSIPKVPIARSTGHSRLIAAQRFLRVMGQALGQDPDIALAKLDVSLPARRRANWHDAGTVVAGTRNRLRQRRPVLDTQDLHRIVHAASRQGGDRGRRDRALVALHCFSGLRPEEIVRLRWEQLTIRQRNGEWSASVSVTRRHRNWALPLPRPSAEPLIDLQNSIGPPLDSFGSTIFRSYPSSTRHLSYRAARGILSESCERAGLPRVEAVDLRAAFAHWLRLQGLSDHETAAVLGLEKVRSVDRLLARHRALDAQRRVREILP